MATQRDSIMFQKFPSGYQHVARFTETMYFKDCSKLSTTSQNVCILTIFCFKCFSKFSNIAKNIIRLPTKRFFQNFQTLCKMLPDS